jgi:hypothetical protein
MKVKTSHFVATVIVVCLLLLLGWVPPIVVAKLFDVPIDSAIICCLYSGAIIVVVIRAAYASLQKSGEKDHGQARDADG